LLFVSQGFVLWSSPGRAEHNFARDEWWRRIALDKTERVHLFRRKDFYVHEGRYLLERVRALLNSVVHFFTNKIIKTACSGLESNQSYSSLHVDILKRFRIDLISTPNLLCLCFTPQSNARDLFEDMLSGMTEK